MAGISHIGRDRPVSCAILSWFQEDVLALCQWRPDADDGALPRKSHRSQRHRDRQRTWRCELAPGHAHLPVAQSTRSTGTCQYPNAPSHGRSDIRPLGSARLPTRAAPEAIAAVYPTVGMGSMWPLCGLLATGPSAWVSVVSFVSLCSGAHLVDGNGAQSISLPVCRVRSGL